MITIYSHRYAFIIDQLWLTQPADFNFTKRSKFTIEGVDDAVEFQNLMASGWRLGSTFHANIIWGIECL